MSSGFVNISVFSDRVCNIIITVDRSNIRSYKKQSSTVFSEKGNRLYIIPVFVASMHFTVSKIWLIVCVWLLYLTFFIHNRLINIIMVCYYDKYYAPLIKQRLVIVVEMKSIQNGQNEKNCNLLQDMRCYTRDRS